MPTREARQGRSDIQVQKSSGSYRSFISGGALVQPGHRELHQFFDVRTAVVARDLLVQVPPDPLDRVVLWAVRRQVMQLDPVPPLLKYALTAFLPAAVWKRALSQTMDHLVAAPRGDGRTARRCDCSLR